MEAARYILWSSSPDTSDAGIQKFCRLNAGRYGKSYDEMMALPLSMLIPRMWDEIQSWRLTTYAALNTPSELPIFVIADRAGEAPFSNPEMSCSVLTGETLSQILDVRTGISTMFYSDGQEIRCKDLTENGADHYLFRELTTLKGVADFATRISKGEIFSVDDVNQFSRSLAPKVHRIYGWPDPSPKKLDDVLAEASARMSHSDKDTKSLEYSR